MKSFLEYVAEDIINKYGTDLSATAIVFPNKRASLFLNDYLVRAAGKPLWCPSYITISDLFRNHSNIVVGDDIKLVCDLHKSFIECTGIDEPLDHFYGWGQLLLSDFDDIDKNMADANKVFANLRDIHELDGVSYLSKEQVDAIKKFFSNFSEEHNSELKKRFIKLWSHFYDIYVSFNKRLNEQGLAYEGALYRSVVSDCNVVFGHERYLFVGFNLLHKVEKELFKQLKEKGKAKFYWDFDRYYMPSNQGFPNEAGRYIASYLDEFPNELDVNLDEVYDNFASAKAITYISSSTETIQARYVGKWLNAGNRIEAGRRTAVVLCDEGLLKAVIHSFPDNVKEVNVTTGYPLAQSPLASLVNLLVALQVNGYSANRSGYRLSYVNAVLNHPYISYISSHHVDLYNHINKDSKVYYPTRDILCIDNGLELLFSNISDGHEDMPLSGQITAWMLQVLNLIASNSKSSSDQFFKESLFKMHTMLNRINGLIESGDLYVDTITLQRLMNQIIQSTSIPFHGEPAVGVQVMGVLETRNLDFDHLLILSCNEGNMPKGIADTSFIPYSLRKAYELTTIDNKIAVYSYYFYRLLQRANDITIMYNTSVGNGKTGEMSRFMLQLLIESNHNICKKALQAGQIPTSLRSKEITKTAGIIERLRQRFCISHDTANVEKPLLTPSAINRYMRCQLQFFYNYVCRIKEQVDNDDIDNRVFGNIFHFAAQKMYEQMSYAGRQITEDVLKALLNNKELIERLVDEAFNNELFKIKNSKLKATQYSGLQLINREVITMYLQRLIELDMKLAPFYIVGLEIDVSERLVVDASGNLVDTVIGGRVDRLDLVCDNGGRRMRVVDYKTGGKKIKSLADISSVFDSTKLKDHNDYYLQALLYSMIVSKSDSLNAYKVPVSPALLFIQHTAADDYDPTLMFGKNPIVNVDSYLDDFSERLRATVCEMFNPNIPFKPTADANVCNSCPYVRMCGL